MTQNNYMYQKIHTICIPESTLNIQIPGTPILLVLSILIIRDVRDPGMVTKSPSPALIPARASNPPSPFSPRELSPVVHCILSSAYRNITNDSTPLVASTHWNVLV